MLLPIYHRKPANKVPGLIRYSYQDLLNRSKEVREILFTGKDKKEQAAKSLALKPEKILRFFVVSFTYPETSNKARRFVIELEVPVTEEFPAGRMLVCLESRGVNHAENEA